MIQHQSNGKMECVYRGPVRLEVIYNLEHEQREVYSRHPMCLHANFLLLKEAVRSAR
jgi:hypothetical protein